MQIPWGLWDFKPVEMEITKSKKQESLLVTIEACDFGHVGSILDNI